MDREAMAFFNKRWFPKTCFLIFFVGCKGKKGKLKELTHTVCYKHSCQNLSQGRQTPSPYQSPQAPKPLTGRP